mgnify:CR=1 FL=1
MGGPMVEVGDCSGVREVPGEVREEPGDMEEGEWRVGDWRAPGGDMLLPPPPGDICEEAARPMLNRAPGLVG